jgi:hypothetical protein
MDMSALFSVFWLSFNGGGGEITEGTWEKRGGPVTKLDVGIGAIEIDWKNAGGIYG